jgi:Doubled CXXCH motif (Paired_CXXCH_1)
MRFAALAVAGALAAAASLPAAAARVSDVRATPHNLSASGGSGVGAVKAVSESQVCVFCHTPHAATSGAVPLWNRRLSTATYTVYSSSSLDANAIFGTLDQPGGSSKLCLSCHDGTIAVGNVNVLGGTGSNTPGTVNIPMTGTDAGGVMPPGEGTASGFTRNLGTNLSNDHPISVTYTGALATRDGELRGLDGNQRWPAGSGTTIGVRSPGYRPLFPLEPTGFGGLGQLQCATCHDPHVRETDAAAGNAKFLRQNRFQTATPGAGYNASGDILCLACHDKNQASGSWAFSAHANPLVAAQTYLASAITPQRRDFPTGLPVWKASCLNCHDTHTVQGARRLAREGTDSGATPKAGGASAIEETCYQCHSATPVITNTGGVVPNIKSEFARAVRMPITNVEQAVAAEPHDIGGAFNDGAVDCTNAANRCGADFVESRAQLGVDNVANRHAECTDCHNPHRVVKFRSFVGNGGSVAGAPDAAGTHTHTDTASTIHSNLASGVLRGAWGVEPVYGSASFFALPQSYTVKRGDPGNSADTSVSAAYMTREYQICLKCHSDYGYSDNNVHPIGNRPALGRIGGTTSGTNNLTQYTNQGREFQAPTAHKGGASTTDSGAFAGDPPGPVASVNFQTNNHRSWHPVVSNTGRTTAVRGGLAATNWHFPWRNAVGTQTMYCSDCHGAEVTATNSVVPNGGENGTPWGPHGSGNNFLLKGTWNTSTGTDQEAAGLCFKCHSYTVYATRSDTRTGYWLTDINKDGHTHHADKIGRLRCNWCHVAVPHGWKNKAFLVNLNDVGAEAGQPAGTQLRNNTTAGYNQQPYYMNAILKIRNFRPSGQWRASDCGSVGSPGNGQSGRNWMRDSNENCTNPP